MGMLDDHVQAKPEEILGNLEKLMTPYCIKKLYDVYLLTLNLSEGWPA